MPTEATTTTTPLDSSPPSPQSDPAPLSDPAPPLIQHLRPLVYLSYPYLTYDRCPDYMLSLQRAVGERLQFFDPGDRSDPQAWTNLLLYVQQHNLSPAALPESLLRSLDLPLALLTLPGTEQVNWGVQLTHRAQLLRTLYALLRSKAVLADAMLPSRSENCVELLVARASDLPILVVSDLPSITPALGYLASAMVAPTNKLLPDLLNFYIGYSIST